MDDDDDGGGETLRISRGIVVPINPRNCDSAAERYVRAVRGSRGDVEVEGGLVTLLVKLVRVLVNEYTRRRVG